MNVKHLKFKVQGAEDVQEHVFQLGLGPCGKWVSELSVDIDRAVVTIKQLAYDEDYVAAQDAANSLSTTLRIEHHTAAGFDHFDPGVGWDNVQYMTPTKAAWQAAYDKNLEELNRLSNLSGEVKVFVYRLEDIRGRITALQQEEPCYQRRSGWVTRRS